MENNFEQDKAIVNELVNKTELTKEEQKEIERIYLAVYRDTLPNCNCTNKYTDALIKLALWFRQNDGYHVCCYRMRRGVVFIANGVAYTNGNLTNEIAQMLLETNPNATKFIEQTQSVEEVKEEVVTETETKTTTKRKGRKKSV